MIKQKFRFVGTFICRLLFFIDFCIIQYQHYKRIQKTFVTSVLQECYRPFSFSVHLQDNRGKEKVTDFDPKLQFFCIIFFYRFSTIPLATLRIHLAALRLFMISSLAGRLQKDLLETREAHILLSLAQVTTILCVFENAFFITTL